MTIDVIALITPKPGKANRVEQLLLEAAEKVKANEPGTLKYHLHKEAKGDEATFVILESYKDKTAIATHGQTEYFKRMSGALKEEGLLAAPTKIMVTREVGGYASKL